VDSLPAPYFQADGITLYCGDLRSIVPLIDSVDAVVADPPYNETSLEWDVWPDGWPALVSRVSRSLWCFGSLRMFWDRASEFEAWKLAQDIIWEKQNGSGFDADRFKRVHEIICQFYHGDWKSLHKCTPQVSGMSRKKGTRRVIQAPHRGSIASSSYDYGDTRLERSVIFANNCHGYAVNETQKPETIIAPLLEYSVPPGGIVLDPFAGSGTVLTVARKQGKRAMGIELRESQCEEIVKRLAQRELTFSPL
jgi:site-specific DNA-methyltransferase (adenine-specific)